MFSETLTIRLAKPLEWPISIFSAPALLPRRQIMQLSRAGGTVQKTMTMSDPYQVTFCPYAKWLCVAQLARNQIDICDAATVKLVHRVPAFSTPSHINYLPDLAMVFVSLQGTGRLIAIATMTGECGTGPCQSSMASRAFARWDHGQRPYCCGEPVIRH